jgi:hypothetical protein
VSVAVYTAAFGGYDDLQPHPEIPGVDFIAFTDTPVESEHWDVRVVEPNGEHPRTQAKRYKLFPDEYLPEHEFTVWVDASHEILTELFAANAYTAVDETGIALYEHPWRNCIYDEAQVSVGMEKYAGLPIEAQVESYRAEGHPEHWGLYACGTIARRNTPAVAELMAAWSEEIDRWTYQDQLSFPVVCRRAGIRAARFPLHQVYGNGWTAIRTHHRED